MQAPIFDDHAVRFSQEFYATLADGRGVEQAVGEGRKRINEVAPGWGIPTFYLQAREPFAITPLAPSARADRLWQKAQGAEAARRRQLLEGALRLDPTHAEAQAGLQRLKNQEEAALLYAAAEAYYQSQEWRTAYRDLWKVEQLAPNFRNTRALLAEIKGHLDGAPVYSSQELAQYDQYGPIRDALLDGRLAPFLGWDVSLFGRPLQDGWAPGLYPPVAAEVANDLAQRLGEPVGVRPSLPEMSQYTTLLGGKSSLYDRLVKLLTGDYSPTMLHRLLAELPARLRAKGYPVDPARRLIIFSTAFDQLLEQAFGEAEQPFHLFAYRHQFFEGRELRPARFIHITPAGETVVVEGPDYSPSTYSGHDGDHLPVIVKLCGRGVTPTPESVIVTEDHYLEYLPAQEIGALLPMTLLNQILNRSFLFFGFSVQPWYLRLLWKRMSFQNRRLHDRSWAIIPKLTRLEEEFWRDQEIAPIQAYPEGVVAYVNTWLDQLEAHP